MLGSLSPTGQEPVYAACLTELKLTAKVKPVSAPVHQISADVCVVGAAMAAVSAAAIEFDASAGM